MTGLCPAFAHWLARFPGGVHAPERKELAAGTQIEVLPTPPEVRLPLLQHLGAPCEPVVAPRSEVELGQLLGDSQARVSAPVHASVCGKVGRAAMVTLPNGRRVSAVPIQTDLERTPSGRQLFEELFRGPWLEALAGELQRFEPAEIVEAARRAGLVGLGGAGFPTHIKLTRNPEKPIRWLLVNGCECEPYLTADHRLMLEAPEPILAGALLARRAVGAEQVIVCLEDNKADALEALQAAGAEQVIACLEDNKADALEALRAAALGTDVEFRVLPTRYPQGGEKQLVQAVLRREVPLGGLPLDVGAVVINVATSAALARAVLRGQPLTHRVMSVSGRGIAQPKNLLVPLGTSYGRVLEYCGGLTDQAVRVVAGGPMMGFSLGSLDVPITKGTSGVIALVREEMGRVEETACVRCGRCGEVCPVGLLPTRLALAARAGDAALARRCFAEACVECGCCAFACPAGLPLVQLIRAAKLLARQK